MNFIVKCLKGVFFKIMFRLGLMVSFIQAIDMLQLIDNSDYSIECVPTEAGEITRHLQQYQSRVKTIIYHVCITSCCIDLTYFTAPYTEC